MKRINFLVLIALLPALSFAQLGGKFTIKGKFESDTLIKARVFLNYEENGEYFTDSTWLQNNTYQFKGNIHNGAVDAYIGIYTFQPDTLENGMPGPGLIRMPNGTPASGLIRNPFFELSADNITIVHKNDSANIENGSDIISGAKANDEYTALWAELKNGEGREVEVLADFIRNRPGSWSNITALGLLADIPTVSNELYDELYDTLDLKLKAYQQVRDLLPILETAKRTNIGRTAPAFTQDDVNGKPVSLSDFHGRYILIDFWASWCRPCRAENPNVVKAYAKYKGKGFEILGISLDKEEQNKAWIKAIKDDNLTWTQVSDLKGWENEAAGLYGVRAIPTNVLVDPNGVIIAKNLRGTMLDEKLAELFK